MSDDQIHAHHGSLPYYERQGISPVRYRMDSIEAHFDRRDSLYRSLGLPPLAFRGSRVLEVAAGSGQNSLYVASCHPGSYDLVEPNLVGIRDIRDTYSRFRAPHTVPELHEVRFENFTTKNEYDIVLCENWLGSLPQDILLIQKLASLVTLGGALVITCVPVSGFFPNIMRKLFALRLVDRRQPFEQQTAQLVEMYGPHLDTIADMTRSHKDWVHDCMLLPSYLHIVLPPERLLATVGDNLEVLATFPRFTPEWRWFKGMAGDSRRFNDHMLESYRQNFHNFIDYRKIGPERTADENARLGAAIDALHATSFHWPTAIEPPDRSNPVELVDRIGEQLSTIIIELLSVNRDLAAAVTELKAVWQHPGLSMAMVRDMHEFSGLFGRETVYVSFTRRRDD